MDHLASFGGSTPIKVPYVCLQVFEGSFSDYPERRGWDKEKLYLGDFDGKTFEDTRSFLQEWLYFGPLFHIFDAPGIEFNYQDFIYKTEDGQEWITTTKLPAYIAKWYFQPRVEYMGGRSAEQRKQTFTHVYSCLKEMHRFVLRFCDRDSYSGKYHPPTRFRPLTPELSLSIIVLADSLTKAGFEATNHAFNLDWGVSGLLVNDMTAMGWCPHVIGTLTTTQQVHLLYSASTLGPPYLQGDHTGCNEFICKINQIDPRTYKSEHATEGCKCDFKGPDVNEVIEALRSGHIPQIEVHEQGHDIEVRVVKQSNTNSRQNYVAISHIWSDGLGNQTQNTLPVCQLRRLQKLVDNLDPASSTPQPWWCDTLCVPVDEDLVEWRKEAIKNMKDIYKYSRAVLVLDKSLLAVSSSASTLEIYLRLKLSQWMKRLWTLQEGVLGEEVIFQLLDGTKKLKDLDTAMVQEEIRLRRNVYSRYSFDSHAVLGTFVRVAQRPQHLNYESYAKVLQWRSTSKRSDETLCFMIMLGMNDEALKQLLDLGDDDYTGRMIHFLKSLSAIPITVLFQRPPRLSISGYRWAPTSFLACFRQSQTSPFRPMRGVGHPGPHGSGFQLKSAGLRLLGFADSLTEIGQIFLMQTQTENTDLLRVNYPGHISENQSDWHAKNVDGSTKLTIPAIILGQKLFSLERVDGVLVDIYDESEDGPIQCHYIAWVGIEFARSNSYLSNTKPIDVDTIKEEQEWLIM